MKIRTTMKQQRYKPTGKKGLFDEQETIRKLICMAIHWR